MYPFCFKTAVSCPSFKAPNGILGALKLESRAAPQDGSKMDPEGPKTAQDAPKDGSRRPQDGPKWARREAPRGSQKLPEAPRGSQRLPEAPRGSQRLPEVPRGSQRLPEAPRGPQRLPILVVALLDPRHPGPYATL